MYQSIRSQLEHFDDQMNQLDTDSQDAEYQWLQFFVRIVPLVVHVERCSIFIASKEEGGPVWLKASEDLKAREVVVKDLEHSVVGEAIRTGEPVHRTGMNELEGVHKDVDRESGFTTRDILCVPLKSLDGRRITGAVELINKEDGSEYSENEKALIKKLLDFLERTIESVYLRQEASDLVATMYRTLRRVTLAAVSSFVAILAALTAYWFAFVAFASL